MDDRDGEGTLDDLPPGVFQALGNGELLHHVNPYGDIGLITLWSSWKTVEQNLRDNVPALLDPASSRIAVIANLYGGGMHQMFCNLLFNPQVLHLVAMGQDHQRGAPEDIAAFLEYGLEDGDFRGAPVKRIRGRTKRFPITPGFDEQRLRERLSFTHLGQFTSSGMARLEQLVVELPSSQSRHEPRLRVTPPSVVVPDSQPSLVTAHQVVRASPLNCWEELLVRVIRFGQRVELAKGPRLELLNARAVITEPAEDPRAALDDFGFNLDQFHAYQAKMLEPELPVDTTYTYGNRLRGYFDLGATKDTMASLVRRLRDDPASRGAYVTLWDNRNDLGFPDADSGEEDRSKPCLTTLFFRLLHDRLSLTATFRSHNLLDGWLENVYGLMAIQLYVAEQTLIAPGAITVVSHSLTVNPADPLFEDATLIAESWSTDNDITYLPGKQRRKISMRDDPNGYFVVSVDHEHNLVVAQHEVDEIVINRYAASTADAVARAIAADMTVSLVSHALWLGSELARKEHELRAAR